MCDRKIFEDETKFMNYTDTLHKKNDKGIYNNHTDNNINLDEFEKILDDYVTTHKKLFFTLFVVKLHYNLILFTQKISKLFFL